MSSGLDRKSKSGSGYHGGFFVPYVEMLAVYLQYMYS